MKKTKAKKEAKPEKKVKKAEVGKVEMGTRYEILRIYAEALYDHQDVRMASANRMRCLIRRKIEGLGFAKEEKKAEDGEESSWSDDELHAKLQEAQDKGLLTEADSSFMLESLNLAMKENVIEKEYEARLVPLVAVEPIMQWLGCVKGIGTRNACRLLRYFGYCERFDNPAKVWAYAGLAVVDGHSVKRKKGEKLPYNLKIKTGCIGVIGDSLLKASGGYKRFYDQYKARIQARGCCERPHPKHKGEMCRDYPGHAHRMAIRAMVKLLLSHYWLTARKCKNLPTSQPYAIDKLGHTTVIEPFVDKEVADS